MGFTWKCDKSKAKQSKAHTGGPHVTHTAVYFGTSFGVPGGSLSLCTGILPVAITGIRASESSVQLEVHLATLPARGLPGPSRLTSCDRLPSGAALKLALVDDATGIMSVASDDFKL